jgi:hypothetical protein
MALAGWTTSDDEMRTILVHVILLITTSDKVEGISKLSGAGVN